MNSTDTTMETAVTKLCDTCVAAFERAYASAQPRSPLRAAHATLGDAGFALAAARAMHEHLRAELVGQGSTLPVDVQHLGPLAEAAIVATVLQGTLRDVIRAAADALGVG